MPDLTHIEPERRELYKMLCQYRSHDTAGQSSRDQEIISMIDDLQRAREEAAVRLDLLERVYDQVGNHRPAERRHALTPGLRDHIRDALASTRAAKGAER